MTDRELSVQTHGAHEWERIISRLNRRLAVSRAEADRYREALESIAGNGTGADQRIAKVALDR